MQLYIDSYGAYIGIKNGMFWVKPQHNEGQYIPVRSVKCIFVTKGVRVSSDAMILALEENIPFLFIDNIGRSLGYVWGGQYGSISSIRKKQAFFSEKLEGMEWIKTVLEKRLENQLANLELLSQQKQNDAYWMQLYEIAQSILRNMEGRWQNWVPKSNQNLSELAGTFRGWEGTASRHYYQTLSAALPAKYQFETRSKYPSRDPFNTLLNYLYGMLYPLVELALIKAGLDPYMGVMHIDRHKRPSLVYDCIEPYRHWAEWIAYELCSKDLMPEESFIEEDPREGMRLQSQGKDVVIGCFLNYLEEKITLGGQPRKRSTHIDLDAQRLATFIRNFDQPIKEDEL